MMSIILKKKKKKRRKEISGEWRIYQKDELHSSYFSANTIKIVKNEYNIQQRKDKEFR
jgi:hypothetical protein